MYGPLDSQINSIFKWATLIFHCSMKGFFQNIYRVSRQFSSAAIVSTVPSMIARSCVPSKVVFQESELPDMPDKPISIPSVGEMTNEFLIRQSSILSAEAASR